MFHRANQINNLLELGCGIQYKSRSKKNPTHLTVLCQPSDIFACVSTLVYFSSCRRGGIFKRDSLKHLKREIKEGVKDIKDEVTHKTESSKYKKRQRELSSDKLTSREHTWVLLLRMTCCKIQTKCNIFPVRAPLTKSQDTSCHIKHQVRMNQSDMTWCERLNQILLHNMILLIFQKTLLLLSLTLIINFLLSQYLWNTDSNPIVRCMYACYWTPGIAQFPLF